MDTRTPYQTDVSDEEWAFVAPYLTLLPEDVSQRKYPLREVFNGVRYIVKTGAHWRLMPHDLPPSPSCTNRCVAGWPRAASRRSCTICASCCGAPRSVRRRRRARSWMRVPSNRPPRAERAAAMTDTNGARAPKSMSPWTRSVICWRCSSPQPMSRSARRSRSWPEACKRHRRPCGAGVRGSGTPAEPAAAAAAHGIQLASSNCPAKRARAFAAASERDSPPPSAPAPHERLATTGALHPASLSPLIPP